jgi:nitrogen-specific signal transduction histidine kinase/CheY-like chemotaxis protein
VQRADEKWLQTEAELTGLLDSIVAGALLLDRTGRVRFSNARFGQYFGLEHRQIQSAETFAGLQELISPRFRPPQDFAAPWRSFTDGRGEPGHDELEMAVPTRRVLERFARPVLDKEGRSVGWLELYYDVTGERQIQSTLLQTEKMAAVGQLVSGIAHELNNPLTAIMGYGQLLLSHGLSPTQFSEAQKIFLQAEGARRIVKNLLYFARENKPERTRVDVNEIVQRILALRSYELRIENIAVECNLAADLPETMADPYQLQQVVLNLLMNAEQALLQDRGRGRVRIGTSLTAGNRIALEISPVVAPANKNRQQISEEAAVAFGNYHGRILVVEDEPTVAQLIVDVLNEEGHEAEAVLESQEGLTRLSRGRYDLVICDLRMPRLDGRAFYEALVRTGSLARNRILFVTGDTMSARTMEFLQHCDEPYLAKPFLVEELKLAVKRRLEGNLDLAPRARVSRIHKHRAESRKT